MLSNFFTYGSDLPLGVGFPMFGAAHLLWLLFGTAVTVLLAMKYKKSPEEKRRLMDKICAWFLVGLIVIRSCYLWAVGYLDIYELPLHLCSLAGFFALIHAYKNYDWLGQTLYALCLPGTVFALVFPDWTYYPPVHFITIEGFLFHFGVVVYVVFQLVSGRIRPRVKNLWKVFALLAVIVPPIYIFNKHFDTNYFFVNVPSPGSPLEWLASLMGVPGYLVGYTILALIITFVMELAGEKLSR